MCFLFWRRPLRASPWFSKTPAHARNGPIKHLILQGRKRRLRSFDGMSYVRTCSRPLSDRIVQSRPAMAAFLHSYPHVAPGFPGKV